MTLALALALLSPHEPPATPGEGPIRDWLAARVARIESKPLNGLATAGEWAAARPALRARLHDMLGLPRDIPRPPLHATITGTLADGDTVVEKLHFQSRPGLYATANLYRPRQVSAKLPAVLYVCGHSNQGRDGNKTAYQSHGRWFARHGYVCLVLDTLQLGEVPGDHHGTYRLGRWWWVSAGYTPAGVEALNGVRALDYLCSRPEVDPERIGMTGRSGGGATTVWVSALDERVRVSAPVSGFSDLTSYVTHDVIRGHCDCMFPANPDGWEWTTILALVAPRPLLLANTDADTIFPMDGNRRVAARLRGLYERLGAADAFEEFVTPGPHEDVPALRMAAFRFLDRHLRGERRELADERLVPIPAASLRVFPTDADVPLDAVNRTIDETFVPRGRLPAGRETAVAALRAGPLKALPAQIPAAVAGPAVGAVIPLRSGDGPPFHAVELAAVGPGVTRGTLLVLNPEDEILDVTRDWARPYLDGGHVVAVLPRGCAPSRWRAESPPNAVERAHALVGTSPDVERVGEVIAASAWARSRSPGVREWRVVGAGRAGVLGALAALLDPAVGRAETLRPPASFRDGPFLPGVLRVGDVPGVLTRAGCPP